MQICLLRYKIFDKALKRIQDDSQVSEINHELLCFVCVRVKETKSIKDKHVYENKDTKFNLTNATKAQLHLQKDQMAGKDKLGT